MARRRLTARLLSVLVPSMAVALAACNVDVSDLPDPDRVDGAKPAVPEEGSYLGFWMKPAEGGWSKPDRTYQWNLMQWVSGRPLDIAHEYHRFFDRFPTWWEEWNISEGRTPLISWNGTSSSALNSGRHDRLIRERARAVRDLDVPVFLRYFWEPEAKKKLDLSESPEAYIESWRRIHDIFSEEGTDNAAFVWCPTAWGFKTGEAQRYYPGDDVVDWICADGYNWGDARGYESWAEWEDIYRAFYEFGTAHDKPLMAGEWASVEGDPGEKADWFARTRRAIKEMPAIKAVVYFHSQKYEGQSDTTFDWRFDSSDGAARAFRELAEDPYFNP